MIRTQSALACASAMLLLGCTGSEQQSVREWIASTPADSRARVSPLPDVKPYIPLQYNAEAQLDPFRPSRLIPESKQFQQGKPSGLQPNFEARELRNSPLERYPLDSLRMVGYLVLNNKPIGVIQAEQLTKQVKVGDYIGTDFGLITKITEKEITLREMVQDSGGDWTERASALPLINKEPGK